MSENIDKYKNYTEKMETANTKTELAHELGINMPKDGYWGNVPSRVCGTIGGAMGGNIVKSAIEQYELKLAEKNR
ncbi:alpha/beta-type small acid-soluble spore protein [Clostridium thailandense]|uniref:alpha/beta-type small acid-soluble spore protein n=1 Tax=Clostridium thailandense TaxID=2794346 RepID=UPI003989137C